MATAQIDPELRSQLKEFVSENRLQYPTIKFVIDRIVADFLNSKVKSDHSP